MKHPTLPASTKLRVVIADDSVTVCEKVADLLNVSENVAEVATASTCDEAVEAVKQLRPEVLVLDINMPDGSGIAVLEEISRTVPETSVIMMSNHAGQIYREACRSLGARRFLDKSSEFDLLPLVIAQLAGDASAAVAERTYRWRLCNLSPN